MAYPQNYTRLFDYQSYQNANPTRPLPGDRVNLDLNEVVRAVGETNAFVRGVTRSDGRLANNSVGLDQLDDSVVVGLAAVPDILQDGTDAISQSVVVNAKKQVFVTQFAACANNALVDDSVGINKAIDYVASLGGGEVIFNPKDRAHIKNPIILKQGVILRGSGPMYHGFGAHIKAAADLTAMITSADTTTSTHSCGLIGMTIDGGKGTYTVGSIVRIAMLNSRIQDCAIENSSGDGIQCTESTTSGASWINWITGNSIAYCDGTSISFLGSDSVISNNYITTCSIGIYIRGTSAVRVIGNQIEICSTYGISLSTHNAPHVATFNTTTIVGNHIAICGNGIYYAKGDVGATGQMYGGCWGNLFTTNTFRDIAIDSNVTNGIVGENSFSLSTPSIANVSFIGSNNAGWVVKGSRGMTIVGAPADLQSEHTAWTAFTPTVASVVGTITTVGTLSCFYKIIGKTCYFRLSVVITTVGTASNRLTFTLPAGLSCVAGAAGEASGWNVATGAGLSGAVNLDSQKISLFTAASGFPAANGDTIRGAGFFEIA